MNTFFAPRPHRSLSVAASFVAIASLVAACDGSGGDLDSPTDDVPGAEDPGAAAATAPKSCTELQTSYAGFGGTKLEAGRLEAAIGVDRARSKPYEMLVDEYKRALAATAIPTVLGESGPTFGQAQDRWFVEPTPSAVSIYQAYRVAFEGCLTYTKTDPKYGVAPAADTATAECTSMQRTFWSRTPSPDEVAACVEVAVTDSVTELQPGGTTSQATDPRRRWSYACASVLTAPGFLTF